MEIMQHNHYDIPFTPIPGRKCKSASVTSDSETVMNETLKKLKTNMLKQKKYSYTEKMKLESGYIPSTILCISDSEFDLINVIFNFNVIDVDISQEKPDIIPAGIKCVKILKIKFIGTLEMFAYKFATINASALSNDTMNKYLINTIIYEKITIISNHLDTLKKTINFNDYYWIIFEVVNAPANTYIILSKRRLQTISKLNFDNPYRMAFCVNTDKIIKLSNWQEF
jgi:hypothetical protein